MILTVTFRGSKKRPRSRKPDVLGFAVRREGRHVSVPALAVTRYSRAKTVRAVLFDDQGQKQAMTLTWPKFQPGVHEEVTLYEAER